MGAGPDGYSRNLSYASYDALGNVLWVIAGSSTGAVEYGGSYTYDGRNRLETWTPTGGAVSFFSYDALGNLTGKSVASAGAENQVFDDPARPHAIQSTASETTYGYDADGNRTSMTGASGTTYYGFDSASRLVPEWRAIRRLRERRDRCWGGC